MIDHDDFGWNLARFQLQPELLLKRLGQIRKAGRIGRSRCVLYVPQAVIRSDRFARIRRRRPLQYEIVDTREPGLIYNRVAKLLRQGIRKRRDGGPLRCYGHRSWMFRVSNREYLARTRESSMQSNSVGIGVAGFC